MMQTARKTFSILVFMTQLQLHWLLKYGIEGLFADDTHHPTKYDLKLGTLLVVDGRNRGLPVAHIISSNMTKKDTTVLFEVIRAVCPNLNPPFLMTDESSVYFRGFEEVFPLATTEWRWCRWHIYKAWTTNLSKISKVELRKPVFSKLCGLTNERDPVVFRRELQSLFSFLIAQNERAFYDYLLKVYCSEAQIMRWCSFIPKTQNLLFRTNMICEAYHRVLKVEYLRKSSSCRLDFLVETLGKSCKELEWRTSTKDVRQKASVHNLKCRPEVAESNGRLYQVPQRAQLRLKKRSQIPKDRGTVPKRPLIDINVPSDDVRTCGICYLEDPAYSENIQEGEDEYYETEWTQCDKCSLWIHWACAPKDSACPCGHNY